MEEEYKRGVTSEDSMCLDVTIDKITSRHIAKVLTRLGDTVAPVQIAEIKRQMRFLADDIKLVKIN